MDRKMNNIDVYIRLIVFFSKSVKYLGT